MFRPAQNTVYTTGIMLKGTFTPEASQTIGTDGQPVEDPLVFKTLYYFNYNSTPRWRLWVNMVMPILMV